MARDHVQTDHLLHDLGKRSVRGGAVGLGGQGLRLAAQLAGTAALARLVPREDFGLLAMVVAWTGFLVVLKDFGLGQVTVQNDKITEAEVSTLFWLGLVVSVVMAGVTIAAAPFVAWFYSQPDLVWVTMAMAGVFVMGGLGLQHRALLQRQMRFGRLAAVDLGGLVAGLVAGVTAASYGAGYWALVTVHLVTSAATSVGYWVTCRWRPTRPTHFAGLRRWLRFGTDLTGANVFNYFGRNADDVLIGRMFGAGALGLYSTAYSLLMLPIRQVNAPLAGVDVPTLSRLKDDSTRYRNTYMRIVEKACLITIPGAVFMITTADWLVETVLGPAWMPAADIFMVMGLAALTQPLSNSTGWLFITQERTASMRRWSLVGAIIAVASFVAGLPWGPIGVAGAYAASGLLVRAPLLYWWVGRTGPVSAADIWRCAIPGAIAAAGVLASVLALRALPLTTTPWVCLLMALPIAAGAGGIAVSACRVGRDALRDSLHMFRVLTGAAS